MANPLSHQSKARFATTQWSVVLKAGHDSSPDAHQALASLCETYWYPLYAFARRRGLGSTEAMDATQAFFAQMLEKDYLRAADQQRGRFRSFLLTMFKRFLINEHDRETALKRGGGQNIVSLNADEAESRYRLEPQDSTTPEQIYERRWAITLLDRVLQRLKEDYHAKDKADLFDQCQVYLTGTSDAASYAVVGERLEMGEGAVKVAVHRLRQRYRELLQEEVAQTLEADGDIEEELAALLTAVRRS